MMHKVDSVVLHRRRGFSVKSLTQKGKSVNSKTETQAAFWGKGTD